MMMISAGVGIVRVKGENIGQYERCVVVRIFRSELGFREVRRWRGIFFCPLPGNETIDINNQVKTDKLSLFQYHDK